LTASHFSRPGYPIETGYRLHPMTGNSGGSTPSTTLHGNPRVMGSMGLQVVLGVAVAASGQLRGAYKGGNCDNYAHTCTKYLGAYLGA
jgi:hypothetical protein